jgi:hypothetical protein
MPKFMTIGYGDREGYDRITQSVRDAAHAHDEVLQKSGAVMGIAGAPVQVRNHEAKRVQTPTLAAAIEMVSHTPCAVAYGVVEVWPLEQPGSAAQPFIQAAGSLAKLRRWVP